MHDFARSLPLVLLLTACHPVRLDIDDRGPSDEDGGSESSLPVLGCGPYEQSFPGPVCVARWHDAMSIRFVTDSPAAGSTWCFGAGGGFVRADEAVPRLMHHVLLADLDPGAMYTCSHGFWQGDPAGTTAWYLEIGPADGADGPVITEVLANPVGAEPVQEFVEILNGSAVPVDVSGWHVADSDPAAGEDPAEVGDPLPEGTLLAPGATALLVAEGFVPGAGGDPVPATGTLVVKLDGSIASSGLRNSGGESVFLSDTRGTVVSIYPNALGSTSQGMSAQMLDPRAPCTDPDNWVEGLPTPGSAAPGDP